MILLVLVWLLAGPCADEIRAGADVPTCQLALPRRPPPPPALEPWEI